MKRHIITILTISIWIVIASIPAMHAMGNTPLSCQEEHYIAVTCNDILQSKHKVILAYSAFVSACVIGVDLSFYRYKEEEITF